HSSNPFVMATKAESYIYAEYFTSDLMEGNAVRINFDDPLPLTSSRKAQIFLFDSQKKYLKDYPYEDINGASHSITLNDIPAGAAYYRAEIDEVYYGVKRTYIGKFEAMPERL
ncbi:MAG TPA: hypothetical protein VHO28_10660, partial [Ignavibacteriales bacterium]|nr:hypothetical protein [Ignavibacteriales bacterium]